MRIKKTIIITKHASYLQHTSEGIQEYNFEVYKTDAFTQVTILQKGNLPHKTVSTLYHTYTI